VACSDVSIRIMLFLERMGKGASREELMKQSLAGNEGIFEYNINELVRSGLVSSDSPYVLTNYGKEIVKRLRSVLP
jgi:predicted transcriptional regulator